MPKDFVKTSTDSKGKRPKKSTKKEKEKPLKIKKIFDNLSKLETPSLKPVKITTKSKKHRKDPDTPIAEVGSLFLTSSPPLTFEPNEPKLIGRPPKKVIDLGTMFDEDINKFSLKLIKKRLACKSSLIASSAQIPNFADDITLKLRNGINKAYTNYVDEMKLRSKGIVDN